MLLDLHQVTKKFILAYLPSFDQEAFFDSVLVKTISDFSLPRAEREKQLLTWLNRYRVLFCFSGLARETVSAKIIDFADEVCDGHRLLNKDDLLERYEVLRHRIQTAAPLNPKTQKAREVTSLSSKALWCCYPYDVPMFDDYAHRALSVIARLAGIQATDAGTGYATFVDVWLKVYESVRPTIEAVEAPRHPYYVRTFDRLLWHLGEPHLL